MDVLEREEKGFLCKGPVSCWSRTHVFPLPVAVKTLRSLELFSARTSWYDHQEGDVYGCKHTRVAPEARSTVDRNDHSPLLHDRTRRYFSLLHAFFYCSRG